ncbi:MAG TPA: ParB N-terminal domain-containing protein [Candidatus Saccharimonadales bacterium]|nr:ParB N-terminal domain-containing protein [Candidatus Saccharimonadales bacterium]
MVTDTVSSPPGDTQYVDADLIHVNSKKLRKLSEAKIQRYVRDYERGDDFPPISVDSCGSFFTVRDGRHRLQAQLRAGFTRIAVTVRP